jgi:hypothetical protein
MPRDRHRQATYDAEAAAFAHTALEVPVGLYALGKLTALVCRTSWWRTQHPWQPVPALRAARADSQRSWASQASWEIRFCHRGDTVATLTHELAHLCSTDGHGPEFRRAHLDLLVMVAGPDAAERLERAYRHAGLVVAGADEAFPVATATGERGLLDACSDVISVAGGDTLRHAERINRLLAKAASTTAAEAEALRAKAFELSVRHGIDAAVLEAANGQGRITERIVALGAGPYVGARTALLNMLAHHRGCEVFWVASRSGREVTVVGFSTDVRDVLFLFTELDHAALLGAGRVRGGNTQQSRRQYLFGFVAGVAEQLAAAHRDAGLDRDVNPAAVVLVERRQAVRDHVESRHRVTAARRSKVLRSSAYDSGLSDGQCAPMASRSALDAGSIGLPCGR